MNYRIFSLSALVFLAACNDGHESTSESTFAPPPIDVAGTPVTPVVVAPPVTGTVTPPVVVVVPPATGTTTPVPVTPTTPVVVAPPVTGTVTPPVVAVVPPATGTTTPVPVTPTTPVVVAPPDTGTVTPPVVAVVPPATGTTTPVPVTPTTPVVVAPPVTGTVTPPVVAVTAPIVPDYKKVAAPEKSLNDTNSYSFNPDDALDRASIDEVPSVKHNKMMIKGKEVNYTATAGHLIAKLPEGTPNADQAAVFYMAYTRDDLPRKDRPVTFFWNGGPGSSSFFLHMGSWAPKRVKTDMPVMPAAAKIRKPDNFPLIDSDETLLDQSDLVFVDPVGTGLSQAIKPHKNIDFWGMDEDAALLRDFITRYTNVNQRQSSPKYLYGESYGGIRTPVVAKLLLKAGTSNYDPDPSGEKAIVYSGMILNSPILDFNSSCEMTSTVSCMGFLPTYGRTADYHKKASLRGNASVAEFTDTLRSFSSNNYDTVFQKYISPYVAMSFASKEASYQYQLALKTNMDDIFWFDKLLYNKPYVVKYGADLAKFIMKTKGTLGLDSLDAERKYYTDSFVNNPFDTLKLFDEYFEKTAKKLRGPWETYVASAEGAQFVMDMTRITGLNIDWAREIENLNSQFAKQLLPGEDMNPYDARLSIPKGAYDITFYEDAGFKKGLDTVLIDVFNFRSTTPYKTENFAEMHNKGIWKYRDSSSVYAKSSLPDIVETLGYAPTSKALVLHGYYDLVTPFYQTELDLINMKLDDRVPVKNYEGGHMTYESEEARAPMMEELDKFYMTPSSTSAVTQ